MTDNEATPGAVNQKRRSLPNPILGFRVSAPLMQVLPAALMPDGRVKAIWLNEVGTAPTCGVAA